MVIAQFPSKPPERALITTHTTSLVLMPPEALWEPIQKIRHRFDRQVRRWMPHVNLLYPFVAPEHFVEILPRLRQACQAACPFQMTLARFRRFHHGGDRYTLWLEPEPAARVAALQRSLREAAPACAQGRHMGKDFTPHLSVGQSRGAAATEALLQRLQAEWIPLTFHLDCVHVIQRQAPPADIFHVVANLPLGPSPCK